MQCQAAKGSWRLIWRPKGTRLGDKVARKIKVWILCQGLVPLLEQLTQVPWMGIGDSGPTNFKWCETHGMQLLAKDSWLGSMSFWSMKSCFCWQESVVLRAKNQPKINKTHKKRKKWFHCTASTCSTYQLVVQSRTLDQNFEILMGHFLDISSPQEGDPGAKKNTSMILTFFQFQILLHF